MIKNITRYHCLRCNFIKEYEKHDTPPCVCPACGDEKRAPLWHIHGYKKEEK